MHFLVFEYTVAAPIKYTRPALHGLLRIALESNVRQTHTTKHTEPVQKANTHIQTKRTHSDEKDFREMTGFSDHGGGG